MTTAASRSAASTRSPDAPWRIGIIGTGGISRAHAPGWRATGAELHAFSTEGADAFAAETGAILHPTLADLLAHVDAVDVCTPSDTHATIVTAALDAGRDVVCEKPLALDPHEARDLTDRAAREGRHLLPAHVVRWFPAYATARQALADGAIGRPAVLRFERGGAVPEQPWFTDEARSGGIITDQMIHDLDQAVWMAGPATSVYAVQSIAPAGRTRTAHVVLTHSTGAISHCRGLWGPPGTQFRTSFSLAGDAGKLEHDSRDTTGVRFDDVARAQHGDGGGDGFLPDVSGMPDPYTAEILELAEVLRGRRDRARVTADDGVRAVEIAAAARESLRTGRRIAC